MSTISKLQLPVSKVHTVMPSSCHKGGIVKTKGRHSDCLVYVIKGKTIYTFDDYKITVKENDMLFLAKDSIYTMDIVTDSYEVLFVDFDFLNEENIAYKSEGFFNVVGKSFLDYFQSMYNTWVAKKPFYIIQVYALINRILYELYKSTQRNYFSTKDYDTIKKAVDYIHENFTKTDINITYVSSLTDVGEGHFRRLFSKIYNISPAKYITALRMSYAKELLGYKNISVSEVAEKSGYSDIFYFCKVFKSLTGMTPTEYRKGAENIQNTW